MVSLVSSLKKMKATLLRDNKIGQDEYESPFGLFVKFQLGPSVYSAVMDARSEAEALGLYLDTQMSLHASGAEVLSLARLPAPRIELFPFFHICATILKERGEELTRNYWLKLGNYETAVRTWILDFLRFRREIVQRWAPDLEPAFSFALSAQRAYALHNPEGRWIAMRYYKGQTDVDQVEVSKTSEAYGREYERGFSRAFEGLPSEQYLLRQRSVWSHSEEETQLLGHPFLVAAEEIGKVAESYNRSLPTIYLDAMYLTDSRISNWTLSEIQMIRELSRRFPEVAAMFTPFQNKVRVLHIMHVQEPRQGWVRDGWIKTCYFCGEQEDEVKVVRVGEANSSRGPSKDVLLKLGLSEKQAFHWQETAILYYLREHVGLD